jgi:hypothetical protein
MIGRDLTGYVKFFGLVSAEKHSGWIGVLGTGLTYWLSDNFQLNAGMNFGLTRAADEYNPFVGLAFGFRSSEFSALNVMRES